MKDSRVAVDIVDFSGGIVTSVPVTSLGTKYTPDCINVYGDGVRLKKRDGFSKLNSATVGAGNKCNGLFHWVKSASSQLFMAVFNSTLYQMPLSGQSWNGTFSAVSAHATSGTPLSDSITHFATYAGSLLFTTEARDTPQKMLVTDTSHFNIDSGGAGTAPRGKYIQVWKEQV